MAGEQGVIVPHLRAALIKINPGVWTVLSGSCPRSPSSVFLRWERPVAPWHARCSPCLPEDVHGIPPSPRCRLPRLHTPVGPSRIQPRGPLGLGDRRVDPEPWRPRLRGGHGRPHHLGVSALAAALVVGKRKGFGTDNMAPHNLPMTVLGAAILWFGWFGFNAGSALAAGELSTSAFVATHIAAATATLSWTLVEWIHRGKPTVLGGVGMRRWAGRDHSRVGLRDAAGGPADRGRGGAVCPSCRAPRVRAGGTPGSAFRTGVGSALPRCAAVIYVLLLT